MPKKKKKQICGGPADTNEAAVTSEPFAPISLVDASTSSPDRTEAAVSSPGYFSNSEENDDFIDLPFSSDPRNRALRRCFTILRRHSHLRLLISRAFINRALLIRGFNELLWKYRKQKALRFRRRRLLQQSIVDWEEVKINMLNVHTLQSKVEICISM
jgi:hypothetical protein